MEVGGTLPRAQLAVVETAQRQDNHDRESDLTGEHGIWPGLWLALTHTHRDMTTSSGLLDDGKTFFEYIAEHATGYVPTRSKRKSYSSSTSSWNRPDVVGLGRSTRAVEVEVARAVKISIRSAGRGEGSASVGSRGCSAVGFTRGREANTLRYMAIYGKRDEKGRFWWREG
jgi:hypothetical protein